MLWKLMFDLKLKMISFYMLVLSVWQAAAVTVLVAESLYCAANQADKSGCRRPTEGSQAELVPTASKVMQYVKVKTHILYFKTRMSILISWSQFLY